MCSVKETVEYTKDNGGIAVPRESPQESHTVLRGVAPKDNGLARW